MEPPKPPRLLDCVRERIRFKHYSIRTEQAYIDWVRRYVQFHGLRHPAQLGAADVEAFLSHLATERHVAAATQNQAKAALLFLYKEVLGTELPWLDNVEQAKVPARLPVVLSREEVGKILNRLDGVHALIGRLLYGTGMRILEAMRLRVKDVEFSRRTIVVRDGKGAKDRIAMLPQGIEVALRARMEQALVLHQRDREDGFGAVWLPFALAQKYPNAATMPGWQYVFPAPKRSRDPRTGAAGAA